MVYFVSIDGSRNSEFLNVSSVDFSTVEGRSLFHSMVVRLKVEFANASDLVCFC